MTIKILMPALSPTMTEGNLAKWHVKEGDEVNPGDVIAEIETDKATMEVEAVDEGIVGRILVAEGSEAVAVNETIGLLLEEDEDNSALDGADTSDPAPVAEAATEMPAAPVGNADAKASPLARRIADQTGVDLSAIEGSGAHGKIVRADVEAAAGFGKPASAGNANISVFGALPEAHDADGNRLFASPFARRMASQAGIDLPGVTGSGPNGRIVKADIDEAITSGAVAATAPTDQSAPAPAAAPSKSSEIVKLSTMRKVIASRMIESKTQVPHFYLTMDCELDELLKVRKSLNDAQEDVKISVNDFVIRACAMALVDTPAANVAYESDDEMRQFHTADISVAVAIPGGLITPIVKSAEQKGFRQISAEMKDLATRARDGKLMPEEYQGGSFSLSNLGMFGVKQFDAVINPPQACILAAGAGEQRPVVKNGEIVPATVMSATLSVDHRVVDGAIGAELLAAIKRYIENPALMLL
jgi:pyruvate dehydrogenase E2 component (dihydrolipoamide acetyltransferase)